MEPADALASECSPHCTVHYRRLAGVHPGPFLLGDYVRHRDGNDRADCGCGALYSLATVLVGRQEGVKGTTLDGRSRFRCNAWSELNESDGAYKRLVTGDEGRARAVDEQAGASVDVPMFTPKKSLRRVCTPFLAYSGWPGPKRQSGSNDPHSLLIGDPSGALSARVLWRFWGPGFAPMASAQFA